MKKILLVLSLILTSHAGCVYAQKSDSSEQKGSQQLLLSRKNEVKVNLLYGVIGLAELTYERTLGETAGIGASVTMNFEDDMDYGFSVIPYYRAYFGKKPSSGFFIEGNAGIIGYKKQYDYATWQDGELHFHSRNYDYQTSLGIGVAAGGKFINKNGFLGELFFGLGRMFGSNDQEVYPRLGITLGKRF